MSGPRGVQLLLRCYPAAWRDRYGDELEALVVQSASGRGVPWRVRLDVLAGGGRERLRAAGLLDGGAAPGDRARSGSLLVLCAWAVFVLAGFGVQKASEHWRDAMPASARGVPTAAFDALVIAAAVGSVLVLVGVAAALPGVVALVRNGNSRGLRRPLLRAVVSTVITVAATIALASWAHGLTPAERNGHDAAYGAAFAVWLLSAIGSLGLWTAAAVATARRITLTAGTLRLEVWLAAAVTLAMAAMTVATGVWWASIARSAPWFLTSRAAGTNASSLSPQLLIQTLLMLAATGLGVVGTARAVRALPSLSAE